MKNDKMIQALRSAERWASEAFVRLRAAHDAWVDGGKPGRHLELEVLISRQHVLVDAIHAALEKME